MTSWPQPSAKRARAVLEAALKRKPSERVAFIDGACVGDESLRDEVLDLLDNSETPRSQTGPALQLPQDRAGIIVAAAIERRRNERMAFIDGACAGDDALRVRALALLASVDNAAAAAVPIAKPVPAPPGVEPAPSEEPTRIAPIAPAPPQPAPAEAPVCAWSPGDVGEGRRVGPYQLLHRLGKGGMGSVWAACRADQEYKKIVAIKLVTSGQGNEEMVRRFRNERQVLAGLDHPYIARLLDGASTEDGLPYLVMEYVEGLPIDRYCESHHLSLNERLKLFQKVCSAVQYAHQNLIVHRDIKPANILIGANGEPKLLDFGIARLMTAEFSTEEIALNRGEAQPMTLRYASPEQIRGEPITTESDIYSLGVLLYELVVGEHPFQDALTGRMEIENAILTRVPDKPSVGVARRGETKLARHLRGEIDPILMMALAKQPRGRFPSAESFSLDITRYLNGFPVSPRREEVAYRARRFVRRHAFSVVAAVLVAIALIASTIGTWRSAQVAKAERAKAQSRFEDVRKLANFVLFDFDQKIRSGTTAARTVLVTEALDYLNRLARDSSGDERLERELIQGYIKVGDLQGAPNLENLGDTAGARASYSKALQLAEALRARNSGDPKALEDVARVKLKLGDLSEYSDPVEALKTYREAQAVLESLASAEAVKRIQVILFDRIGTVQGQRGDTNAALSSYEKDLQIAQELFAAHPTDPSEQRRVAVAFLRLGETMANTGAVSEGLEKLSLARTTFEKLAALNPQSRARSDVATVDREIAEIQAKSGKTAEASESYRNALGIIDTLAAEDPRNTQYKRDRYDTLIRLASVFYKLGNKEQARKATTDALELLKPMVDAKGDGIEILQYCNLLLTTPFPGLRAPTLARHYAEQLVKTRQGRDPESLDLLAQAYDATGDARRAVETDSKALELLPSGSVSDLRTQIEKNLTKFRARAQR